MVQRNTGVNIYIFDQLEQTWLPINEMYFQEATTYKWNCQREEPFQFFMQGVPLPMTKSERGWKGAFQTPFQTGNVKIEVRGEQTQLIEQYIYPDQRKMTTADYDMMLSDILKEGMLCFQAEGLDKDVKASGRTMKHSYLQWQYIKTNIFKLRMNFRLIEKNPLRSLKRADRLLNKELVKTVSQRTITWIERNGERYGWTPQKMPNQIRATISNETYNRYENQVLVAQINELRHLLIQYKDLGNDKIAEEANLILDWLTYWKRSLFIQDVKPYKGLLVTSQSFRKHPYYRAWYKWFVALYNFQNVSFDLDQRLSLRDTFDIYEIWVYLQIVKVLRENNLIENYQDMFIYEEERFFLALAKHRESRIKLKNGGYLTFQRVLQNNSNPFYTFTQRMIPDITIEYSNKMFIFDPKYRVDHNIPYALAEMHKYRDGIISRSTNEQVVKEVYILTPSQAELNKEKDFYSSSYHEKYKMGALLLKPGESIGGLKILIERLISNDN